MDTTKFHNTTVVIDQQKWLDLAKQYSEIGSIIPIGFDKKPLIKWKEFQKRKAISEEIGQWVSLPNFNGFAMVTGSISGLFVLDFDAGSNPKNFDLPTTPTVRTKDGEHHYFKLGNLKVNNSAGLFPHVDIRGEGGYAVLPPAMHPDGVQYTFLFNFEKPLADPPKWLLNKLKDNKEAKPNRIKEIATGVKESQRNESGTVLVGTLMSYLPPDKWESTAWPYLKLWNQSNTPPMDEVELRGIYESIAKREANKTEEGEDTSKADRLVKLFLDKQITLFIDQFKTPSFANPDAPCMAISLDSDRAKQFLNQLYYQEFKQAVGSEPVNTALFTLKGIASKDNQIKPVFNRIARFNDSLYYDLADDQQVVEINDQGWSVVRECPIYFRRYSHQKVQLTPIANGQVTDILEFLNIAGKDQQLLALVTLCVAFIPDIPRYLIVVYGDMGSAKSSFLKFIRSVVDPSQTPLVTFSDAAREFSQLADHNYCTFFDNLSHLRDWMSDALCRLVTGDSFVKRKLYSNDEDIIFSYMRVAGLSGINQIATKPDLLDRSLLLGLERVADAQRVEETVLWAKFNQQLPSILGGVLDAVSYALKRAPDLTLHHRPRLVDFYRYALAVSEYLGFTESDLIGAIIANTHRQNQEALESSPTAQTIIQFMTFQDSWEGRSYELYEKLFKLAEDMKINKDFPKSPIWLWRRIKEVRSNLKAIGIETDKHEVSEGTMISLTKSAATTATAAINQGDVNTQASGSNGNNGSKQEEFEAMIDRYIINP